MHSTVGWEHRATGWHLKPTYFHIAHPPESYYCLVQLCSSSACVNYFSRNKTTLYAKAEIKSLGCLQSLRSYPWALLLRKPLQKGSGAQCQMGAGVRKAFSVMWTQRNQPTEKKKKKPRQNPGGDSEVADIEAEKLLTTAVSRLSHKKAFWSTSTSLLAGLSSAW